MSKETEVKKINQEEYQILKNLDARWKWLARDSDTFLWAYETKPERFVHPSGSGAPETVCHFIGGEQFHFIRSEDESPYNIAELIEEYEVEEEKVRRLIAEEYAHSNNCSIVSNEFLKDLQNDSRKVVRYETSTFLERLVYLFTKELE